MPAKPRVAVYGDVMLDVSVHQDDFRPTQEDATVRVLPVPNPDTELAVPGGTANVAANLAAMGCEVTLYAPWADDAAGRRLKKLLAAGNVFTVPYGESDRTTVKTRYYAGSRLVGRVDADGSAASTYGPPGSDGPFDAVVISDYGKGSCDREDQVRSWARSARLTCADPHVSRLHLWQSIPVDTLMLNWTEALAFGPVDRGDPANDDHASRLVHSCRAAAAEPTRNVVVKRGRYGSILHAHTYAPEVSREPPEVRSRVTSKIRPYMPSDLYDAQGAGDTYAAGYVTGRLRGMNPYQSCLFASAAAGVAVGRPGTVVVTIDDAARAARPWVLDGQMWGGAWSSPNLVVSAGEAAEMVRVYKRFGLAVGYTNGCFDARLHAGHRHVLREAAAACDVLLVGVDSDARVAMLKGPGRPVVPDHERVAAVAAVSGVRAAFVFDCDPAGVLRDVDPDVLFKGGHYAAGTMPELDGSGWGGRFVHVGRVPAESTTQYLARTRNDKGAA